MDTKKRKRLEAAGWSVGDAAAFLKLTPEESALVEMRLALSQSLRERRVAAARTQTELAKQLGSSQSRVAKLEAGDPSVSLELLIRALLAVGASRKVSYNAIGLAPQRSSGCKPVWRGMRASIRGPISSPSWKANT
jgi:DNA-binding XRE family transcriptional regulator